MASSKKKQRPRPMVPWIDGIAEGQVCRLLRDLHDEMARQHRHTRRQTNRNESREDLLAWSRRFLPKHFCRPASKMHRWLAGQLDRMNEHQGTKLNILGPRGGAKSTIGTLAYPLRAALEGTEPYIWILSDTRSQAHAHLENLKVELTENSAIATAYPDTFGAGPVWRKGAIQLKNGTVVEAFGTGQRLRGRRFRSHRPTLIVCDDLQNDDHIRSAAARDASRNWFHGTLLKAGTKRTNLVNLATALHVEAIAMELVQTAGWTSRVFRAIESWPKRMSLWEKWETIYGDLSRPDRANAARAFYETNRAAMDEGAVLLWPEEEDLYTLMRMRAESGRTAFEREKQNSPINPDQCEWPESYFDESIWFDDWPERLAVKTLALDPSKGADSRRGDYSALVALGIDRRGLIYVEADLARRPVDQITADGVEWVRRFQPDAFGIEANQFQELLGQQFTDEFRRQGLVGITPYLIDNRVNKLVRIRRLGPYLSSGRIRFKNGCPSCRLLVDQLRSFPMGDHDDGPDALEMAIRLAIELNDRGSANDRLGDRLPVG